MAGFSGNGRCFASIPPRIDDFSYWRSLANIVPKSDLKNSREGDRAEIRAFLPAPRTTGASRNMTNIPTELLRTLIAVVDLRSFTKAAQALGVTQPAVSAQIKRLQVLLGGDLFDKSAPGVTLTEKGEVVVNYARRLLSINDADSRSRGARSGRRSAAHRARVRLFRRADLPGDRRVPRALSGYAVAGAGRLFGQADARHAPRRI